MIWRPSSDGVVKGQGGNYSERMAHFAFAMFVGAALLGVGYSIGVEHGRASTPIWGEVERYRIDREAEQSRELWGFIMRAAHHD